MSEYKAFKVRGETRYMRDGKFVKKSAVPMEIRELNEENPVKENEPFKLPEKRCVFCGEFSNWTRLINGQSIVLCESHYYSETVGKVAQKVRERENAQV